MGFFSCIWVGLIVGALGCRVMPGVGPGALALSLLMGVAGASVGTVTVGLIEGDWLWSFSVWSVPAAAVGAVALLTVYRLVVRVTG